MEVVRRAREPPRPWQCGTRGNRLSWRISGALKAGREPSPKEKKTESRPREEGLDGR